MFIRPILGVNLQLSSSLCALSPFAFPFDLWLPCKSNLFSAENQHKTDAVEVQKGVLLLTSQGSTLLPSVQQKDQVMLRSNCVPESARTSSNTCCGTADRVRPSLCRNEASVFPAPRQANPPAGGALGSGGRDTRNRVLGPMAETRCSLPFACGRVSGLYLRQNSHSSFHCKEQTFGGQNNCAARIG